ncbi:UDP-2,4-diacetamido-2,4,6-trideoxy-beta-L-altropyranose hydrolase [Cytobacillus firmus]|uniref:UDP-2,4-diacetamido-2,4, 6-trideoxy-beta-L-altropyranose hydrolase n=1 Tax=Cytobacillus firmus TaxID=1399 RepID=UPI0021613AA4|nr:UDP-2,4-diacetamido-2,4,6-trideoxy-beta-L-altropyranose hydrolase [Cytobacillus firmus]MCS0674058.1 UDP-2,4-diacetamido-2,4,6-trideoxy-beta-L-altropyranose hydrolase [Cytobacillus firmus]
MKVVFRVDASIELGIGHVMRCLTLAEELRANGSEVFFICRVFNGDLCDFIQNKGFYIYRLKNKKNSKKSMDQTKVLSQGPAVNWKTDAFETIEILKRLKNIDWLVIDHYALDKDWESQIRSFTKKVMVIDDLANREHECDMLLDQNYYINRDKRYQYLLPSSCKLLLGPNFALLREEFWHQRLKVKHSQRGLIQRVFICFGGSDPSNVTGKILRTIDDLKCDHIVFDVVVGASNQYKDEIKFLCEKNHHFRFFLNADNIAQIMSNADMCIVSGGTLTWERYCLGLVGGIITTAKNQEQLAQTVHEFQIDEYIGRADVLTEKKAFKKIESMLSTSVDQLVHRREMAMKMVDGIGVKRVISAMND